MNNVFHRALGDAEVFGNGFVGDVFNVLMGNGLPGLLSGTIFRKQSVNGFSEEMAAQLVSEPFYLDDEGAPGAFIVNESSFSGVMVVES